MRTGDIAKSWAALVGVILVAVGVLGFVDNPLVGKADGALIATNEIHNLVHLGTGLLALYIAFGVRASARAAGVIGFGALYAVIFGAVVLSPNLFGLFGDHPSDAVEHVIHASVAIVSLGVGAMARRGVASMA